MARPKGISTKQLDEAARQRIRTLYFDAKLSPSIIAHITDSTKHQIRDAIRAESAAVAPRPGRPRVLTTEQEQLLVDYVTSSKQGRFSTYLRLSQVLFDG
ncbi:hypothetical protein CSAL01_13314 [Colletotrichum salicis]|uniref:Transposase n=1 Tax=Colletotrichum salicis TaxID=1209931 RepID=A0A135V9P1_9PEZI|nr:hypothetical protein CSAL01_13314 [Colletotrichum salicis]